MVKNSEPAPGFQSTAWHKAMMAQGLWLISITTKIHNTIERARKRSAMPAMRCLFLVVGTPCLRKRSPQSNTRESVATAKPVGAQGVQQLALQFVEKLYTTKYCINHMNP